MNAPSRVERLGTESIGKLLLEMSSQTTLSLLVYAIYSGMMLLGGTLCFRKWVRLWGKSHLLIREGANLPHSALDLLI